MKKIILQIHIVLAGIFLCSAILAQEEMVIDKVIAKVGGEYILYSELITNYRYQKEQTPDLDPSAMCFILEQMIAQKILLNQAKLDSIEVSDDEVEGQLDYRMNNILRMLGGDEQKFVQRYGKSVLAVKDDMREDLRQQILAEKLQRNLINEVKITPKEVVSFFENIPKDSIPYLNAEVELGEIIYHPRVNEEQRRIAREKIEDILSRIVDSGEDFAEMAGKYSQDGSAQQGGDLGWVPRSTFVTEFEAEAFSLEVGEISQIVETEFGFHIIQLLGRRGNQIHTRHILIKPEITPADLEKAKEELDSIRHLVLADSMSFELAVKLHSDDNSASFNNNGRMVNPNTGTNYFETSELPFDIYFAIESVEEGDITEPLEFTASQGKTSFRIIKLISKTKPHVANLGQDYTKISNFAKESKKSQYYNEWMINKMESTFIEIESDFVGCTNLTKWIRTSP